MSDDVTTLQPLHQPYPWVYRDAQLMFVDMTFDADEVAGLLPSPLVARTPARAVAWTLRCENIAGAGAYQEFVVHVVATDGEGTTVMGTPYIYVNNDAAAASGREVLGVPKKVAEIEHDFHNDQLVASVRRSGVELATLGMTLDREGDAEDRDRYQASLARPSRRQQGDQLFSGGMEVTVHRVVHGRGFIDSRASASDPFYLMQPRATGHAALVWADLVLLPPEVTRLPAA